MAIFGKGNDSKPVEPPPPARPAVPASSPAPAASGAVAAPAPRSGVTCVIGSKITIKGEVTGDEDVVVEGTIEGQVRITRDCRVSPTGSVKASIEAQSIIVSGEVTGNCTASSRVEIQATGRLTGDIRAPRIVIAEGAMFRGTSDMSGRRDEPKDKAAS